MPRPTSAKPPVSAWLIRERKRLGLKPLDVAARLTAMGLPVQEGTVRTWEAGRSPSPDNVEGLERIFETVAPGTSAPDQSAAYLARIDALVEQMAEDRTLIRELVALLRGTPQGPEPERLIELATREVAAIDEAAGKPRPQTTSRRRTSGRGRPSAERRQGSREGETA